jgi:anaerobic selenocysteine-containing dehydrogenase
VSETFNPPLRVLDFIATRKTDAERGTKVWMNKEEADTRILTDGELVWVHGPRRHELAELGIDDRVPRGHVVLRDIAGTQPSEVVTIVKVDTDTRRSGPATLA